MLPIGCITLITADWCIVPPSAPESTRCMVGGGASPPSGRSGAASMRVDAPDAVRLARPAAALRAHTHHEDGWATLESAYAQCLWLGEAHTPLHAFLGVLQSVEHGARRVAALVRTAAEVRARFPAWARATLEAMQRGGGGEDVPASRESAAMHAALAYGPLAHTQHAPRALGEFVHAIHCREYVCN